MPRPIGYYVHHQGAGHLHRARLIAGALGRPCALLGTFPGEVDVLSIPDDRLDDGFGGLDGCDGAASRPEALHYAPLVHGGIRARMAAIAGWIATHDPVSMVVDVSVEVALFARLMSVPVVLVRLSGRRDDRPHLEAFRAAERLIAPFPAAFEPAATPAWVVAKTTHVGFLAPSPIGPRAPMVVGDIALVFGRGGPPVTARQLVDAARALPNRSLHVYGETGAGEGLRPANLHLHGWVDDVGPALDRAEIVVGGAGDGLLAEVVARGKRFVCLPEVRAFDEQTEKAEILAAGGLAIVLSHWPMGSDWPAIVCRALALDAARLGALHDPAAVAKAAAAIEVIAARFEDPLRKPGGRESSPR